MKANVLKHAQKANMEKILQTFVKVVIMLVLVAKEHLLMNVANARKVSSLMRLNAHLDVLMENTYQMLNV